MDRCTLRLEGRALLQGEIVQRAVLLVQHDRIAWCGPAAAAPPVDVEHTVVHDDGLIAPAYIDLHVHGAAGADASDGTLESLGTLCRTHAAHGTAALCPTVLTSAPATLLRALEVIADATGQHPGAGARVLGSHLEGPFLSPRRAGAQPVEHLRAPDRGLMLELLAAARGTLRIVTLAPELPGALELVQLLVEQGVTVSLGHSDATFDEARAAIDRGARLAAHTFNAMRPLHHREAGVLGAVLLEPDVTTEVIADGVHVSDPVLRLLWRLKGPSGRLCLVTDCTAALQAQGAGARARLGQVPVEVRDGAVRLADGTLAGSNLVMQRAVRHMAHLVDDLPAVLGAASTVPRAVIGLCEETPADVVLLDDQLAVRRVLIGGRWFDGAVTS